MEPSGSALGNYDIVEDQVIGPGSPWAGRLEKDDELVILDLEGRQAVDFLCYDAVDPTERYNAPNTMKRSGSILVQEGTELISSEARVLMTVLEDTVGGHDTIGGCCSAPSNTLLYGKSGVGNCRDNFLTALRSFGLGLRDIVPNVNWFMKVRVTTSGGMAIDDGLSVAGDFVRLRADTAVLVAVSNCPQVLNPANGYNPTPVKVSVARPR